MFVWTPQDSVEGIFLKTKEKFFCWASSAWSVVVGVDLTPQCFWLELELFESRSFVALFVPKLTTWLAPARVCSLACSWLWPAQRCSALWAPLPVLVQEALRWSSLCAHQPCRWRREAAVRARLATWVPTPTSLASPCCVLHPCLPTSAASSTHEKTGVESGSGRDWFLVSFKASFPSSHLRDVICCPWRSRGTSELKKK